MGEIASGSDDNNNSSSDEAAEELEDFNNDPLQDQEQVPSKTPKPTKKGPGRTKKWHCKIMGLPKKIYNTRSKTSSSDANTSTDNLLPNKFVLKDGTLVKSGMSTTFKSWADQCDEEAEKTKTANTPPKHGTLTVHK